MADSQFVYVTFIRTTPEKLWCALIEPEFTRQFWFDTTQKSDWKPGASWQIAFSDGRVGDTGEIVEIDPPRRLVLKWRNELFPEMTAEGYSRMTYELEPAGECVKLTLTHVMDKPDSKFIKGVSKGWPIILSSLKSLLETGKPLEATRSIPKGM
ncbi:MAG: SRPBCC family protein [Terracidiphilus sp.]|jgi:uncharacterized protein YndB with AHSA1/START domain